jgi:hypothetical protein
MACGTLCHSTSAVLLYNTATRNTSAPTGTLNNSGWQYEGQFGGVLGTPISSDCFITAYHVGGTVGVSTFEIDNTVYQTTAEQKDPNSDLAIWTVSGTFSPSVIAPLWNDSVDGSEVNQQMVVFGRGTPRGSPVYVANQQVVPQNVTPSQVGPSALTNPLSTAPVTTQLPGTHLAGWEWATSEFDPPESWGQNSVAGIAYDNNNTAYLAYPFLENSSSCMLSAGDSGGGVFVNDNGVWRLAGVNYGVDGPWQYTANGGTFDAAIFDASGLYLNDGNQPAIYVNDGPPEKPAYSYSTQISPELGFINGVIDDSISMPLSLEPLPEPGDLAILALAGCLALRRRRARLNGATGHVTLTDEE